jgi:hypothetical protein
MSLHWTSDQILALAPDASAAKDGRKLASPARWANLGRDDRSAWGECKGSAKVPYQSQIDLSGPAFKCTCPSRKFPCKHTLALFLLLVDQAPAFARTTPPTWVTDWLAARARAAEKRAQKEAHEAAPDPAAQAKRAVQRQAKVEAGLQELSLWLGDLMRGGLAALQGQAYDSWDGMARRLEDAQAPGLARRVRHLAGIPASGANWPERLLDHLSRLHLLIEGFSRIDSLSPAIRADIRFAIGWTQNQDDLLAGAGLRDRWLVLGQRTEEEDRLMARRTWLWGQERAQPALDLQYIYAGQARETSLVPGICTEAELVFYPGAFPLRAVIKARSGTPTLLDSLPGHASIRIALETVSAALAQNPWLEQFPISLRTAIPIQRNDGWSIYDHSGARLPVAPGFERGWSLLALSGGHPIGVFGEWDGQHLLPLSAWADGRFVRL